MTRLLCWLGWHVWEDSGAAQVCMRRWCRGRTWRSCASGERLS